MVSVGEVFADAGLHIDNASFAAYSAKLKAAEGDISDFSSASSGLLATAFTIPAAVLTGVAAYGATVASSYEDATLTLETLYGSQEKAQEKFQWLQNFASKTPFEFPELLEAATRLKAYGMDIEQYGTTLGDTASAMGKPIMDVVEAIADAQQGEFERMKEFGVKAVEITKKNYETLGATVEQVGQTALTYMDNNGKQQIAVVDRNNKEMITSTIEAIWNERYAGAMEKRSQSFSGMMSTIKDNLKAGLAELAGFDMATGTVETNSLLGALKGLASVALDVTGAFANMSEPMQTFIIIAAGSVATIGLLTAGILAWGAASALVGGSLTALLLPALTTAVGLFSSVIVPIGLVAAALIYLEEKTGAVSWAWQLFKDIFTITVDGIMRAAGILKDWIVLKVEEIKQALIDMIPPGWVETVSSVWNGISSQFGKMKDSIHTDAEEIRQDNQETSDSFSSWSNIDASGTKGEIQSVDTLVNSLGSDTATTLDTVSGLSDVPMSGTTTNIYGMQNAMLSAGATGQQLFYIISDAGNVNMSGTNYQISMIDSNGKTTSMTISQLQQYLQTAGNVGMAGTQGQLALVDQAGKTTNITTQQAVTLLQNAGNQPMSGTIAGINGIGNAATTTTGKVNGLGQAITRINMMQPKWNSVEDFYNDPTYAGKRAPSNLKMGVTKSGGSGTGEGNVKIVNNTKINTVNNNGSSTSTSKMKKATGG